MRVLMLSDVYFPRINGVSTSIETFRARLGEYGVGVDLIVPAYGGEDFQPGIERIPAWRVPGDPEDRMMQPLALRAALRRRAAEGYDLVHVQTPFLAHYAGVRAARAWGVPVIETYHTFFEEYLYHYVPFAPATWMRALARWFSRRQGNAVDAVVVPSSAMRERLRAYGVTAPLHVLPTGIPLHRFGPRDGMAFRRRHGIAPERLVALYVGRVAHEKNIDFIIAAMARVRDSLPEAMLLITGEGPAQQALEAEARAFGLGDAVRFMGYLDRRDELLDCYAAADVFVFASRTETQGLVLLEAMAMGLPVVALAVMGTRDVLLPASGALTPEDDVEAFAAAIIELLADPARRRALGVQGRAWVESLSDSAMAQRMAQLYRHVRQAAAFSGRMPSRADAVSDPPLRLPE